jgi:hypothetical protein
MQRRSQTNRFFFFETYFLPPQHLINHYNKSSSSSSSSSSGSSSQENDVQASKVSVKQATKLIESNENDKISAKNTHLTKVLENLKKNDIIENLRCDNKTKHTANCSTPSGLRRRPLKAPKDLSFIEKGDNN